MLGRAFGESSDRSGEKEGGGSVGDAGGKSRVQTCGLHHELKICRRRACSLIKYHVPVNTPITSRIGKVMNPHRPTPLVPAPDTCLRGPVRRRAAAAFTSESSTSICSYGGAARLGPAEEARSSAEAKMSSTVRWKAIQLSAPHTESLGGSQA